MAGSSSKKVRTSVRSRAGQEDKAVGGRGSSPQVLLLVRGQSRPQATITANTNGQWRRKLGGRTKQASCVELGSFPGSSWPGLESARELGPLLACL